MASEDPVVAVVIALCLLSAQWVVVNGFLGLEQVLPALAVSAAQASIFIIGCSCINRSHP